MWKQYFPIYERLESEFTELTYVIELNDSHLKVYSLRMSELILRIGSECENASKSLLKMLDINAVDVEDMNFPALGKNLCQIENFENKEIQVIWPYQKLTKSAFEPFEGWKSGNPDWYKAYNKIKHDRDSGFQKANYENCLYALGGLFILNLYLRKENIESSIQPSIHIARERVFQYSQFFSPAAFLRLKEGLTFPSLKFTQ